MPKKPPKKPEKSEKPKKPKKKRVHDPIYAAGVVPFIRR